MTLADMARTWPDQEWWLALNSGLPIEGYLPAWFIGQLTAGIAPIPGEAPPQGAPPPAQAAVSGSTVPPMPDGEQALTPAPLAAGHGVPPAPPVQAAMHPGTAPDDALSVTMRDVLAAPAHEAAPPAHDAAPPVPKAAPLPDAVPPPPPPPQAVPMPAPAPEPVSPLPPVASPESAPRCRTRP